MFPADAEWGASQKYGCAPCGVSKGPGTSEEKRVFVKGSRGERMRNSRSRVGGGD